MKIKTERLILRDFEKKDMNDLIENINNLNISKWLLVVPYPYTKKDAEGWINHCAKKKKQRKDYNFGIEFEGRMIGCVGLSNVDEFQGTATIGYWLGEKYWRQGIMKEALQKVLDFAFNQLKLRRINVEAYTKNEASNNLIKKMGFKFEGTRKKSARSKADGKIHDANEYGLLKEEWKG